MNSKNALKKLRELLGEEAYEEVLKTLAGVTVYFPANTEWTDLEERNQRLREDFYSGLFEVSELAKKYNLSISRVYKIIQCRQ